MYSNSYLRIRSMERSLKRHFPNKAYIVTTGSFHIASGACNRAEVRVREFGSRTSKIYIYIFCTSVQFSVKVICRC